MPPIPRTKKDQLAALVAKAVHAGEPAALPTVDFSDPNRPKTCLEVDFPIVPVNQVAAIEGNAGKPIYQMSKWWARRRSSVFRSLLLAAATKAPEDPSDADKVIWDAYYKNHQKKGVFKHLKVADIFMGGGTTLVEGSRLGMQMYGVDLNPVAWFVVKNELAQVDKAEVEALLAHVEAEVKPQIMPFYACDCPRGHKGVWTRISTGETMRDGFDPLALTPEQRCDYRYEGPEIIYVFWAKHGPCQVTDCGHRTPLMGSPVVAVKTLSVKAWENHRCPSCRKHYDIEDGDARMAPGVPLFVAEGQAPFAVLDKHMGVMCPHCDHRDAIPELGKGRSKKLDLTLLVHPQWLAGSPRLAPDGTGFGGSATDAPDATARWNAERASRLRLVEVRGKLPEEVTCPETGVTFKTGVGNIPKTGAFACRSCGKQQRVYDALVASGTTAPVSGFAVQGFCPACARADAPYGGRFFAAPEVRHINAAHVEWAVRSNRDLADWFPKSEIPFAHMTHQRTPLPQHGYSHWWKMFNPRQLLVQTQILRSIVKAPDVGDEVRDYVLGAWQQYLRNQNMFCFWNVQGDKLEPLFANNNFHPKSVVIENGVFADSGRGNWRSCCESLPETIDWARRPWEVVSKSEITKLDRALGELLSGESVRVEPEDPTGRGDVACGSATELKLPDASQDLAITDPPFGGLLFYAELSNFFYVWLRLGLRGRYPEHFTAEYVPKALEAVANPAVEPDDPDGFYKRLLTQCWREAARVLKPGGILAFTFHHSEDEPWVAVLESLFDAGFYLEATYPIRSDETKGEGEFGSKQIEYDIIHVCRKRTEEPTPVSWGRMRREVMRDVSALQKLLEHHTKAGLPAADLHVIRRGKALEYFSRHYNQVFVDDGRAITVKDALLGVNLLLDEAGDPKHEPPPVTAEPHTRQFLRIFDGHAEQPRDQMQKFLRGTGSSPNEFIELGWCEEEKKIFRPVSPLDLAREWKGKHRRNMVRDFDQAMFLVGACFEGSGINARDTLVNADFKPHPALKSLLEWQTRRSGSADVQAAATRALAIYEQWERTHEPQAKQMEMAFGALS